MRSNGLLRGFHTLCFLLPVDDICISLLLNEYRQLYSIYELNCQRISIQYCGRYFLQADDSQEKDVVCVLPEEAALTQYDLAHSGSVSLALISICSNQND